MYPMIVLIDGNSLTYAYHNGTKLSSGGIQTQAIFGMMNGIREILVNRHVDKVLVLWDSTTNWREKAFKEYKAQRNKDEKLKKMREEVRNVRPMIRQALKAMGVTQLMVQDWEADDLAGYFATSYSSMGKDVRLITGDKDWIQLVNSKTTWHDPIRDRTVSRTNFKEFTGVSTPDQFIDMKALVGDASDNINGVPGIGEKCALALLDDYGSVNEFLKDVNHATALRPSVSRWKKKLLDFAMNSDRLALYARNIRLMDLRKMNLADHDGKKVLIRGKYSRKMLQHICDKYAFNSINRRLDDWTKPLEDI